MTTLVLLLEEQSAREMLKGLLPRLLPDTVETRYVVFEGKQDLEKQLARRLRGWQRPDSRFIVLRDQDSGDCRQIKESLQAKCRDAGRPETIVRIACRELEAWYLGDPAAVESALEVGGLTKARKKAHFRNPDAVVNPAARLTRLTSEKYQKVSGSRAIGPLLNVEQNDSRSFQVFISAIRSLFPDDSADI